MIIEDEIEYTDYNYDTSDDWCTHLQIPMQNPVTREEESLNHAEETD